MTTDEVKDYLWQAYKLDRRTVEGAPYSDFTSLVRHTDSEMV